MEFEIIANENYSQLAYVFLAGGLILAAIGVILIGMALEELTEVSYIEPSFTTKTAYTMIGFGVVALIGGAILLWIFFTAHSVVPTSTEATHKSMQNEIKTVYGLEVTDEDISNLLSYDFWVYHGEETRLEFYGTTTTLTQNNEIINIQLVEVNDEYQLVYAIGEPNKLEELEKVK